MLGVGRIFDKHWVVYGKLAVRRFTEPTLCFHHCVCDGETDGLPTGVAGAIEKQGAALVDL